MSIDERTLVLATAVSIDFDSFSQHSHGSGMMPLGMMVPYPGGGGGGEGGAPGETPDEGRPLSLSCADLLIWSTDRFVTLLPMNNWSIA